MKSMRSRMPAEPFSKRYGVRPKPPARKPDEVPDSAKIALVDLIDEERGSREGSLPGAYSLGPRLSRAVGKISEGPGDMQKIQDLIYGLEWWEFYDACEALLRFSRQPEKLAARIEALFASEGLPYKMRPDGIKWRLSEPATEISDEVTVLASTAAWPKQCPNFTATEVMKKPSDTVLRSRWKTELLKRSWFCIGAPGQSFTS